MVPQVTNTRSNDPGSESAFGASYRSASMNLARLFTPSSAARSRAAAIAGLEKSTPTTTAPRWARIRLSRLEKARVTETKKGQVRMSLR